MTEERKSTRIGWRAASCLCLALLPVFILPLRLLNDGIFRESVDRILYLSLVLVWPIAAALGVVGAWRLRVALRRDGAGKRTRRVAAALLCVTCLCVIPAAWSFLVWGLARQGNHNESAAVANLRVIHKSEEEFRSVKGRYGGISDLVAADLLAPRFREALSGYRFHVYLSGSGFVATATAASPRTGKHDYYVGDDGVVRSSPVVGRAAAGSEGLPIQ